MSCTKHLLGFRWERHAWRRRVTDTRHVWFKTSDQWGRWTELEQVMCHAEYVCDACGAVRDDGDCGCELAEGERCAIRLAWLRQAEQNRPSHLEMTAD